MFNVGDRVIVHGNKSNKATVVEVIHSYGLKHDASGTQSGGYTDQELSPAPREPFKQGDLVTHKDADAVVVLDETPDCYIRIYKIDIDGVISVLPTYLTRRDK